jgi:glutathionyl-hydroquinone reductase
MGICGNDILRLETVRDGKTFKQVMEFKDLEYGPPEFEKEMDKPSIYNKMNDGIIKIDFVKHMTTQTKLRIHNMEMSAQMKK